MSGPKILVQTDVSPLTIILPPLAGGSQREEGIMRITYDEKVDALYIRLKETRYYESDEVKEGILLDFDKKGNLIGIEILDASDYLSGAELASFSYNVEKAISR